LSGAPADPSVEPALVNSKTISSDFTVSPGPVSCPNCGAKISAAHQRCPRCRAVVAAVQPEQQGGHHYAIASAVLIGMFVLVLAWLWYNNEAAAAADASTAPAVVATARARPFGQAGAGPACLS
jgi:hypothetical protein